MYKMIVVEDESKLRAGICDFYPWEELNFEIVGQMSNGKEALDFVKQNPVDVVLTDISMPIMTGIELAEQIREEFPQIHIIFLSGYADFSYAQKALRLGVNDYLLKPVRAADLTAVFSSLRHLLDEDLNPQPKVDEGYIAKIVQTVQRCASANLKDASLEKVAEAVNLSPGYISTVYKQATGQTFSDFLMDARMREAKVLLLDIHFKTYEIAEMLGYENPKNFTRAFKQFHGVSPREFKKAGFIK